MLGLFKTKRLEAILTLQVHPDSVFGREEVVTLDAFCEDETENRLIAFIDRDEPDQDVLLVVKQSEAEQVINFLKTLRGE